jgi:hypothetical protein
MRGATSRTSPNEPKVIRSVHLAASHRLLRAQHYQSPESVSHFSSFALCSAGKDQGNLKFELATLRLHIRFYLMSLPSFIGIGVPLDLSVTDLSSNARVEPMEAQILSVIRSEFKQVDCGFDGHRTKGRGYCCDLCFHLHATNTSGQQLELVDGGSVNWTQKFLSNAKVRLIISGIGSERLSKEFGNSSSA